MEILVFIASLFLVTVGSLLLLAPRRFIEFGRWWGRVIGFPQSAIEWREGSYLGWRLPGLYLLIFGGFLFSIVVRHMLLQGGVQHVNAPLPNGSGGGLHWYQALGGPFLLLIGAYILARTDAIIQRMIRNAPFKIQENSRPLALKVVLRIVGGIFVLGGIFDLVRAVPELTK